MLRDVEGMTSTKQVQYVLVPMFRGSLRLHVSMSPFPILRAFCRSSSAGRAVAQICRIAATVMKATRIRDGRLGRRHVTALSRGSLGSGAATRDVYPALRPLRHFTARFDVQFGLQNCRLCPTSWPITSFLVRDMVCKI